MQSTMLKRRDFYHQRICYSFNWNLKHHKQILNKGENSYEEFKILGTYFKRIYNGEIPEEIFNSREVPRISRFKITGLKRAYVNSLSKQLIRSGIIKHHDAQSKFPKYAQNVYLTYKTNRIYKTPGHGPVLKNILIRDENAVAIEVPIWKKFRSSYLTGHIDLIQFDNDMVKVIDYKPEGNFLLSLPQVATYGLLIKSNFFLRNISCISFNKHEAWEFEPRSTLMQIGEYLQSQKINRPWEYFLTPE